uniref:Uncharacterized protein n=1 Tax=Pseudomonas sp. S-47 TaxID=115714 RepID=Q58HA8_9PSED|nr:hypothetical protein [Pseudomonas sp. S-47]AAX51982.1 hypothetical protein [Pseudomonas sp. S-47]
MAISDSIVTPSLLGRTVTLVTCRGGVPFEHTGTVVGVLQALPGSRASASIMVDEGPDRCDFHDLEDIDDLAVL